MLDRLLSGFEERAQASEGPESFLSVAQGEGYRLGVTMEADGRFEESIELMLRLYRPGEEMDTVTLAARLRFLSLVQDRHYSVLHLDHGWVCCILSVRKNGTSSELTKLIGMLRESFP
jgi:hypothetical protein